MEAVNKCVAVFMTKSAADIEKEIEKFYLHHDDVLNYPARQAEYEESIRKVEECRAGYLKEELEKFETGLKIAAEAADWDWSPLYANFILNPMPPILSRPFSHTKEEFDGLLDWLRDEGSRIGLANPPPHFARALKLFSRSELGARTPMLCPVKGLTAATLNARPQQVLFAMEELIRVGKIYFPTLDTLGEDFADFRVVLDSGNNTGEQVEKYTAWRTNTFIRACVDMVALDQAGVMRDMWLHREGVDREAVCRSFRTVLLLRENIDLEYCLGSLECIGVWPKAGEDFFESAKAMRRESLTICKSKISAWNLKDNLEDLDDFRASQVLCTFDQAKFEGAWAALSPQEEGSHGSDKEGWNDVASQGEGDGVSGVGEELESATTSISPVVVFTGAP